MTGNKALNIKGEEEIARRMCARGKSSATIVTNRATIHMSVGKIVEAKKEKRTKK